MLALRTALIPSIALVVTLACSSGDEGGGTGNTGTGGTSSSTGGTSSTTPGTEGGPCYPNSTCNQGLRCASNLCVNLGGGTGGSGNTTGSGGGGTGGTQTGTGGTISNGGTAGHPGGTGGLPGTGGSLGSGGTSSTGGQPGTGGATSGPQFGACFSQADGFTTCDQYCASVGGSCVYRGCGSYTAHGYASSTGCNALSPGQNFAGLCSDTLQWFPAPVKRCCCQ
jgi:hypothetical protein